MYSFEAGGGVDPLFHGVYSFEAGGGVDPLFHGVYSFEAGGGVDPLFHGVYSFEAGGGVDPLACKSARPRETHRKRGRRKKQGESVCVCVRGR